MSLCFHAKAGRFSTALQLGNGEGIFSQSRFCQDRSRSGNGELDDWLALLLEMSPPVTKIQYRRD
jgi:hypothetical protein